MEIVNYLVCRVVTIDVPAKQRKVLDTIEIHTM